MPKLESLKAVSSGLSIFDYGKRNYETNKIVTRYLGQQDMHLP